MLVSSLASAIITCTSVFTANGGDPHAKEYVTRVQVDYEKREALVKEYSFEAFDLLIN